MASRKRGLSKEEIERLLFQSDNSTSELDSDDSEFSSSDSDVETNDDENTENNDDSHDSDATVDYDPNDVITWSDADTGTRSRLAFTGIPGIRVPNSDTADPLEYFNLFFTDDMMDNIVTVTNRRAQQLMQTTQLKRRARLNNWVDTTCDELKVLFALFIYQGIVQKPEIELYWSTKPLLETPYVRMIMTEKRFNLLLKCLHFTDNNSMPNFTSDAEKSFWKIKKFFDALIERFSTVYIPEAEVVIDESLMLWKGRLAIKQYIPLKRARFGLKTYELCEARSGYIWNSITHIGKAMQLSESPDRLVSSQIVLTLMKDLLGKGYCLFTDNWYSSPLLFRKLHEKQTDAVGTARVTRKHMPTALKQKIRRGETVARFAKDMMALKWYDKKEVTILSTFHRHEMTTVRTRRGDKDKPKAVLLYNTNMGGVDLADQMLVAYPAERKRHKVWYKKQFRHLLNQTVLNAYILFKKDNDGVPMTHLQFRIRVIERLLECHHQPSQMPRRGRPSKDESNPLRLTARHFPKFIPATNEKEAPTRRCKVCCSKEGEDGKKVRRETRYFCEDGDVALYPAPCFGQYHTKRNY